MVFSSLAFLYIFLPVCIVLYFGAARSIQQKNVVLLIMSLLFYAWGEPKWIILMIFGTLVEYFGAKIIDKNRGTPLAKIALAVSVFITLGILFVFKYFDFFTFNINQIFGGNINLLGLTLPIGISFYTFQTITYIVDVYRGRVEVQESYFNLLLYVSMFPQLIAGPIVKYIDINNQIEDREFDINKAADGVIRFLIGLSKKAILANIAGELAKQFLDSDLNILSVVGAWVGILSYTLQIYFDFSAYSDMAIGLGKIFGFDYPENFNYPYIATSINDFWKRWHITLTTFFREYLYIPLGGNRNHHVFNLLLVWFLTGLWHGASWNFILWGLYYYVLIVCEKLFMGKVLEKVPGFLTHIYTMFIVIIGWVFFYFDDLSRMKQFFGVLFGPGATAFINTTDGTVFVNHILFFIVAIIAVLPVSKFIKRIYLMFSAQSTKAMSLGNVGLVALTVFLLFINTAAIVGSTYNPFLYFRF